MRLVIDDTDCRRMNFKSIFLELHSCQALQLPGSNIQAETVLVGGPACNHFILGWNDLYRTGWCDSCAFLVAVKGDLSLWLGRKEDQQSHDWIIYSEPNSDPRVCKLGMRPQTLFLSPICLVIARSREAPRPLLVSMVVKPMRVKDKLKCCNAPPRASAGIRNHIRISYPMMMPKAPIRMTGP